MQVFTFKPDKQAAHLEIPAEIADQVYSVALFGKRNTYYTTLNDE